MKSVHRFFIAGLMLLLSIGAVAGLAAAQMRKPGDPLPPPPPSEANQQEPFADTVNVTVTNVDVYVTDKQGKPVTGLGKGDFQLFENGRPVEITNFYAEKEGRRVVPPAETADAAPAAAAAPDPAPAAASPEPEAEPTPADQRLRLIIYIDNFNLRPFNRNRVMRELRAFIGRELKKDDQLMLVTYDRELHIRRTFTSDSGLIAAAMLELEKISAQGVHADSERRDVLQRIQDSRSVAEAESYARSYAQSTFNDLSFSVTALKKMVDALAGMPGRKAVLYVSDGLQMVSGQDVFYAVQNKYSDQSTSLTQTFEFDASRRFTELTAQANANRVTFYTIDAAGLRVYESTTAENQGPGPTAPGLTQIVDSVRFSNLQTPLQVMAEKTGGVAIINTNVVTPQLNRIANDFNTYYSLGYTPSHYGDGRYYKVEVKVKNRKDLLVRHREGYRDKSTDARMTDGTLAALNFPFEENPLGVSIEFGQARPREDGYYLVPVMVRIPIGKLVLVPREKSEDAKVRLFIAAMDADGGTSDVQQTPVPISVAKADVTTAASKHFVYEVTLLMRKGEQRVAVGVRDDVAAQASFVSRGVKIGR
ncbi:MAG TPA: VWA domain-containing protein [Thermoanaerobaculia bacterium]|nr:VWA domain-containing protein [Thermoanaerobaculia bacterium]